jgi:hypothetical protein
MSVMPTQQDHANHVRWFGPYHFVLAAMLLAGLIGAGVNLYESMGDHQRLYSASLLLLVMVALIMTAFFARFFALRAQDRVIRLEENFRHHLLTGRLLDSRLTVPQIIGLRFASDAEFVALAKRAADEGLSQQDIKKAIKSWRVDEYRV